MTPDVIEYFRDIIARLTSRLQNIEANDRSEIAGALEPMTFATLPVAGQAGRMRLCTNCRKVGEGAGLGTGTPVYDDGVAWRRTGDDTTAAV